MPKSFQLGQEIVDLNRGIHAMFQADGPLPKESGLQHKYLDIDLAPVSDKIPDIETPQEAIDRLRDVYHRIEGEDAEDDFMRTKVCGAITYIGHIAGIHELEFDELVAQVTGYKPTYSDQAYMKRRRMQIDGMLKAYGKKQGVELGYDRDHVEAYFETFGIPEDQLKPYGMARSEWAAQKVMESTILPEGVEAFDPRDGLTLQVVKRNKGYVGGFYTAGKGGRTRKMLLNVHRRHRHTYGAIDAIDLHEWQHAYDYSIRRREAAEGRLNPIYAQTTVHGPENLHSEFNAQAQEQVSLRESGEFAQVLQANINDYYELIWNDAHIALNRGADPGKVLEFMTEALPMHKPENFERAFGDRMDPKEMQIYANLYEGALRLARFSIMTWHAERQRRELGVNALTMRTYPQMQQRYARNGRKRR